jgi:hypothetical protein
VFRGKGGVRATTAGERPPEYPGSPSPVRSGVPRGWFSRLPPDRADAVVLLLSGFQGEPHADELGKVT